MSKFEGVDRLILNKDDMYMLINTTGHFAYLREKHKEEFFNNQQRLPFKELLVILKDANSKNEFNEILEKIKNREKDGEGKEFFEYEIKAVAMKHGVSYEEARKLLLKTMSEHNAEDSYHVHLVIEDSGDILITEYLFINNEYGKPKEYRMSELSNVTASPENIAIMTSLNALLYVTLLSYEGEEVEKEFVESEEKVHTVKKNSSSKKRSKSPVKLRKVKTQIYRFKESAREEKRKYERSMESWGVRGHWRTYRDGKRVWIKPFKKGEGNVEGKEYKL